MRDEVHTTGRRAWLGFAAIASVAALVHLLLMSGTTFYVDEWTAIFQYGWRPYSLLSAVNGHNAVTGRLTWYATMGVFGTDSYLPFRGLGLLYNLFAAGALFHYGRVRHSTTVGACMAALSLGLGASFHTVLWPASAIGLFSMGALPLCLLLLAGQTTRRSVAAVVLLLISLGTGAMGLVVLGACLVETILRRRLRQLQWFLVPIVIYGAWYARYGGGSSSLASWSTILGAPDYAQSAFTFAAAGLLGIQQSLAALGAAFYVGGMIWLLRRSGREVDWPRFLALASAACAFWLLTAVFRGGLQEPGAPRYIAFGALPMALLAVEAVRPLPRSSRQRWAILAITVFSLAFNVPALLTAEQNFRTIGRIETAQLAALELVRPTIDPAYVVPSDGLRYVDAGQYFKAIDRFGSPAISQRDLPTADPAARTAADGVLIDGHDLRVDDVGERGSASCSSTTTFELRPGQHAAVRAPAASPGAVTVMARRFGDPGSDRPVTSVAASAGATVDAVRDGRSEPWTVDLSAPARVCR